MQWIKEHLSAIFLFVAIIISLLIFFAGYTLTTSSPNLASLMFNLAGSLLAIVVSTIFFSLPDTANYISKNTAKLISSGDVAELLSQSSLLTLYRGATRQRLKENIASLPEGLFSELLRLSDSYISGPYLSAYEYSNELSQDPTDARFLWSHSFIRYTANIDHLVRRPYLFQLRYGFNWEIDKNADVDVTEWVSAFTVLIDGESRFSIDDLDVRVISEKGRLRVEALFSKEVELSRTSRVEINSTSRVTDIDPIDVMFFRYPVFGMSGSFSYDTDREYDLALFRTCLTGEDSMMCASPKKLPRSIHFSCQNQWALPGGGFSFTFPKKR